MHKRILFGVVAWLLGAATATAGSLLAVSLLGQGIGGSSAQQLTRDAVNRALASEVAESISPSPSAPPKPTPSRTARPAASPSRPRGTDSSQTPSSPAPSPIATPTSSDGPANPGGTVLTSKGGEVVAICQPTGAYLLSWSPMQGYEVGFVSRGPGAAARVSFESLAVEVTMVVTCSAGVPSATSNVDH